MDLFFHQGLPPPFTEAPSDPTYAAAGSDARLKWEFSVPGSFDRVRMKYYKSGTFVPLADKYEDGRVAKNQQVSLSSRITIEGNATLVISQVNTGDATKYSCTFYPSSGPPSQAVLVQLVVTGKLREI